MFHYNKKICDPLPASGNTPNPCLPERSGRDYYHTLLEWREFLESRRFCRTKTASGSQPILCEKTHSRQSSL